MTDRSIASRPSLEQVIAIVDFMEKHPALGLGQMRGLEKRDECKKLWFKLTKIVNSLGGPNRPMKSWVKYWADKKSTIRSKVQSSNGDPNTLSSNIEKKIWDLFLANDSSKDRSSVKQESHYMDESFYNEDSGEHQIESEPVLAFEEPMVDLEERQMLVMEKLARAVERLATSFEAIGASTHDVRNAMVDIDSTMKRFYNTSPA
ncbi:hypothetical protein RR48_09653 [Papilio machaon]|uniref:Uncharacterized protein n=1 Tax=Papilio machaon TaxID=76193 RepID=A0A194REL5_PAPMA|nr:hypothetical protein RR48_09653 [Papilio machaon]